MADKKSLDRCVIITGLSGAGKTTALNALDDQGFYAVDNIPPSLLPQLASLLSRNRPDATAGIAAVVDVRAGELLHDIFQSLEELKSSIPDVKVVFLESSEELLVRRFEMTRRRHPLGEGASILKSITDERERLVPVRSKADIVIDTTRLQQGDLRERLLLELGILDRPQTVIVSSFGFKNGAPRDCDYMFDVRLLPNPNYVPELKALSGKDAEIRAYLDKAPEKITFMRELERMAGFVLEQYAKTVKKQLHIAIGCTGGRHRSVAIAEELAAYLSGIGHSVTLFHRDIDLEAL
jgi:UPF0042 nucleotide-binding protein